MILLPLGALATPLLSVSLLPKDDGGSLLEGLLGLLTISIGHLSIPSPMLPVTHEVTSLSFQYSK